MTESKRIDYLIEVLESGNGAKFGERIGAHKTSISAMRKGTRGIRLWVDKIIRAYPNVRREWLTTGEGYPGDLTVDLVRDRYEDKIAKADKVIDHLMRRIEELENQRKVQEECK